MIIRLYDVRYRGYARDVINRMRRHCGDINRINTGFNRPVVRGYSPKTLVF